MIEVLPGSPEHRNLTEYLDEYGYELPDNAVAKIDSSYNEVWECGDGCCWEGPNYDVVVWWGNESFTNREDVSAQEILAGEASDE